MTACLSGACGRRLFHIRSRGFFARCCRYGTAILRVLLRRRLRQAFPSVWNELGRPFSFGRHAPSTSTNDGVAEQKAQCRLIFFIVSGQYRDCVIAPPHVWSGARGIVLLALTLSKGCRNADIAGLRCKVGGGYRRTIAMRRAASRNESLRPSPLSVRRGAG